MATARVETKGEAGQKFMVRCAFCDGKGKDPFEIPSRLSDCQVCLGKGEVKVKAPVIECAFCDGSGVHRDQRLTCVVCGGKGLVKVTEPLETCSSCGGKGVVPTDYLPCLTCHGTGVVTSEAA